MAAVQEGQTVETAPGFPELVRIRAPNPGPMTLEGTNTYLYGSDPCLLIDPGPAEAGHMERIRREVDSRGGIGGILLTHSHLDHSEAVAEFDASLLWGVREAVDEGSQLAAAYGGETIEPVGQSEPPDPEAVGPFQAVATPGHSADHACFVAGSLGFCGDLLLGRGSTIVPPRAARGSLADYMASLDRLEAYGCELLCPGHGPWIQAPRERIDEQRRHRQKRESALVEALVAGADDRDKLLRQVWSDVPDDLLPAASLSLQAHLEKLAADGVDLSGLGKSG